MSKNVYTHTFFNSLQNLFGDIRTLVVSYLLRSCSGECLGSSSDEERSELRYSIWIAEFRELVDLWTHAAFWLTPVCSFTGVYNSFSVTISVVSLRARLRFSRELVRQILAGDSVRQASCSHSGTVKLWSSTVADPRSNSVGFDVPLLLLVSIVLLQPFTQHNLV